MMPQMFSGMRVVVVPETVEVDRTWRERLLTLPWRPWVRRKLVRNQFLPEGHAFQVGDTLYLTQDAWNTLKRETYRSDLFNNRL